MSELVAAARENKGGLSANALKTIAIVAMVVDHAARAFVAEYYSPLGLVLHMVGRITGPVMFYFIAEGYHRSRHMNRYTLRLGLFALASYLPFIWFRTGGLPTGESWMELNVIYTLFLAHLMLRARHEVAEKPLRIILMALCLVAALPGDWGLLALLYILAFDSFRGDFAKQALGYALITFTQLLPPASRLLVGLLQGLPFEELYPNLAMTLLYCAFFVPLLLLRFYNGRRGAGGVFAKWGFYVVYPAHLLVLGWLRWHTGLGA